MFGLIVFDDIGQTIGDYIRNNLIPNWVSFTVQFAALIIMILVIFFVAYKPVKKILKKRADYVEENIRQSEEAKALAIKNARESENNIIASRQEASRIVADAKLLAENNKKQTLEATQLEINRMKADADADIARSKEEAKEEIRAEMVSVALAASEEVLKREINQKDNSRIVEDFIKDIDK